MPTTGSKFLHLSKVQRFTISQHALDRLEASTGRAWSVAEAEAMFLESRYVKPERLLLLGYRPAYGRRRAQGQPTWYFRIFIQYAECIFVIGRGQNPEEYIWLTTYTPNSQTLHYRVIEAAHVAVA